MGDLGAAAGAVRAAPWPALAAAKSETARPAKLVTASPATTTHAVAVEATRWTRPSIVRRANSRARDRPSCAIRSSISAMISGP
jgi:hypothetical protein